MAETSVQGWTQTSATCSDGSPVTAISLQAGETVTCTFTNTLAYRIAVIVCTAEATPRFHPSDVTLGATVKSATTGGALAATLCTQAANFNDLTSGVKSINVNIDPTTANTSP